MDILERNRVTVTGDGETSLVFVHGFGCEQSMWDQVAPRFADGYRVITYDLTGMGRSDLSAYDHERHADLRGHAEDLLEVIDAAGAAPAVVVGHSVGGSIAVEAARMAPDKIAALALVSPSPRFMDDPDSGYVGGFGQEDLEGLVTLLDENHLGWSHQMAPTIVGQDAGEPQAQTLTQSFCATDPEIASHFGRVTFFSDCREAMAAGRHPCLIVHCDQDALVPMETATWMRDTIPDARLVVLSAPGHCPHMTRPDETADAIRSFLAG